MWTSLTASHSAELLPGVCEHDHGQEEAGWLKLKVLKQGQVWGVGARKARRKMKVSLVRHKAEFNHAQHHLLLRQMGAERGLRGT